MRVCYACKVEKPLSDFYRSNVHYYQKECKACNGNRKSDWYRTAEGKQSNARSKLKARFGITQEYYDEMLSAQNGKCLICYAKESFMGHKLAVDHCHKTNVIRGLLCKQCNLGLGNFQDSPELMDRAASYMRERGST